jgi:hypothetical protein
MVVCNRTSVVIEKGAENFLGNVKCFGLPCTSGSGLGIGAKSPWAAGLQCVCPLRPDHENMHSLSPGPKVLSPIGLPFGRKATVVR